ncbi:hypothetical protein [Beijerinckia indica]|uniref:Uncharacterized protein n=1 Tax=Beijerinckia indica subsp. indica (strain ATCC 9039 / DSM 1715 / NCIMB 8712) TaxID=395963 RepID=B2IDB4_BEII9|nr:hypothetical protein [Beijerinckia indica]ACB93971.1 hypothetical protein Bind_0317 [Beijerinckia indica subsp. indica ATCC 9039]
MNDDKAAKEAAVVDRGETIGLMEPMLVSESSKHRTALTDLAIELASRAAGFRRSLPQGVMTSLSDLVRAMNCYYSNLIEGHDTHPIDIERALKNDYSADAEKRNLQLEAKAHIIVQRWIDEGGLKGRRRAKMVSWKSIADFANCFPKICCGQKILTIVNCCKSKRVSCASTM